jgi:hypothetical protein
VVLPARDLAPLDGQGDVAHHLPGAERAGDVAHPQALFRARDLRRRLGRRPIVQIQG